MIYCRCESWETSQNIHKKRTPVMFGVLFTYRDRR
nr:MAG TPA: phospho-N-acetylmuramoyl-pentapeptide-transferase [Caudoviricetes sp.]